MQVPSARPSVVVGKSTGLIQSYVRISVLMLGLCDVGQDPVCLWASVSHL